MNTFDIKNNNKGTFYYVNIISREFSNYLKSFKW